MGNSFHAFAPVSHGFHLVNDVSTGSAELVFVTFTNAFHWEARSLVRVVM